MGKRQYAIICSYLRLHARLTAIEKARLVVQAWCPGRMVWSEALPARSLTGILTQTSFLRSTAAMPVESPSWASTTTCCICSGRQCPLPIPTLKADGMCSPFLNARHCIIWQQLHSLMPMLSWASSRQKDRLCQVSS